MAAKGLETVRQKFEADNAAYIESIKEMIDYNDLFIDSIRLVQEQIKGIGKALGDIDNKEIKITVDAKQAIAEISLVKAALAGLGDKTVHIRAVSDALGDMGDTASDAADAVRDIGDALGGGGGGHAPGGGGFLGDGGKAINDAMASVKDQIDALLAKQGQLTASQDEGAAAIEKKARAVRGITDDMVKAARAAQDWAYIDNQPDPAGLFLAVMGQKVEALKKVQEAAEATSAAVAAAVTRGGEANRVFNEANFGPWRQGGGPFPPAGAWPEGYTQGPGYGGTFTWPAGERMAGRPEANRPYWGPYSAGTGGAFPTSPYDLRPGGEGGTFAWPTGLAGLPGRSDFAALWGPRGAGTGAWPSGYNGDLTGTVTRAIAAAVAAARGRGAGDAAGGGIGALAAAAAAGLSGGAGGFGGAGFGGFFGGGGAAGSFDPKSATGKFAAVAANIGRIYPYVHWGIMLANELLATAGPAAVALGGAALVGTQGGQQLFNRYQALSAAQESVGAATGQSMATFLNVPNTLQKLQTQYGSGEVYGIAGAGINALHTGGGNAFLQLGQNTLSMLSGAAADFVLALQGGLGKAAAAVVQGGTGYAQQFGNVLGNVGKTLLNVGQQAPGVGAMLLTTLQAATGGISDVTKALGPGLLPLLGFEAGTRYGPPIVGGAAAALQALPFGLGGKVATVAHAATAAEAAASGGKLAIGDLVGAKKGAGIAGVLGGLGAPEIGALAVATIAVVKGLTGKTADQQKYAGLASSLTGANLAGGLSQIATEAFPGGGPPPVQPGVWWKSSGRGGMGNIGVLGGGFMDVMKGMGVNEVKHFGGLAAGIFTGHWSDALHNLGGMWQDITSPGGIIHGLGQMLGIVGPAPSPAQAAMQQMGTAFTTWSGMLGSAGQVQDIWKGMGSGALSTSDALNVLAQSGVNINTAFQKNGDLTAKASQQVKDYVAGYQAMTGTVPGGATGGTLAAINAVGIAGGLQASKLATVNAAFSQAQQITAGGAAGTAALTTLRGAMPSGIGQGPTSAAGAAAETAYASTTQPSVLSQVEQNTAWLRTAQQLNVFGTSSTTQAGMAKYLIGQALTPGVRGSALAMAQLSPIAQEYGMAPLVPGESAKQYAAAFKSFLQGPTGGAPADTAKQYVAALAQTTEKVGNLPQGNQAFVTAVNSGAQSGLANAINLYGQQVQNQFMGAFAPGKGGASPPQEQAYAKILAAAGLTPKGAGGVAGFAAETAGATPTQVQHVIQVITQEVKKAELPPPPKGGTVTWKSVLTPPAAGPAKTETYSVIPKVTAPSLPPVHNQTFGIFGIYHKPSIPKIPDQSFTITGHVVMTGGPGGAPQPSPYTPAGAAANLGFGILRTHGQHGFRVPGWGGGDHWPAMLEGGEAVVPKHLVPSIAPFLSANKVPGFASGGIIDVPSYAGGAGIRAAFEDIAAQLIGFMQSVLGSAGGGGSSRSGGMFGPVTGGPPPHGVSGMPPVVPVHIASVSPSVAAAGGASGFPGAPGPMPAAANKVIDAFEKTFASMPGPWSQVASQILNGLLSGVKNSTKETAAMAQTLVNKVTTEINFGRSVTNTAVAGLNFGGMQVATPTMTAQGKPYQLYTDQANIAAGGQPGSVQEQMGSYLQAMQSFQGDMGKLAKGGLEKRMMQQLYAAGPVQGDAEAQSILGGAGGIKAANSLYDQINSVATKLGVSAIGNIYGQPAAGQGKAVHASATVSGAGAVHALQSAINSLHGKSVTISVNVTSGGSASGPQLSKTQINQVTKQVQANLLQQAQRNRRTGLTLPGYGS